MWMLNRVSQQSPKKHEGLLHLSTSDPKLHPLLQSQPCRALAVKRKSWEVLWVPLPWPSGCPDMDQVLDQVRWLLALEGWECLW